MDELLKLFTVDAMTEIIEQKKGGSKLCYRYVL